MESDQLPKPQFFFKGFPEDVRFRRHTVPESLEIARGTLYEAWYRCVKFSPYIADAIDTGHWRSDAQRQTYEWFGDLRETTFDEWWVNVGYNLFREEKDFRRITVNAETEGMPPDTLRFEVPLTVSPGTLKQQFDDLLRQHHPRYQRFDRWQVSTATAKMRSSKLSSNFINLYLQAYEVQQEMKKINPNVKLYEVAIAINADPKNNPIPSDTDQQRYDKHFVLSQLVTEYIEKARNLIANASDGMFPSTENHEWVERSTRALSWRRAIG